MKELLVKLIDLLTGGTGGFTVEENTEDNLCFLTIYPLPDQIGRIIGKSGRNMRAIRAILGLKGIMKGCQPIIKIGDTQN